MQTTIVHAGISDDDVADRIWEAACGIWSDARRYSTHHRGGSSLPARLDEQDLVISTSPLAARMITGLDARVHICALPAGEEQPHQRPEIHAPRLSGAPGLGTIPANVTHVIAPSQHALSRWEERLHCETKVLTPPVDTLFFHPVQEPREPFYLLAAGGTHPDGVMLAVEACRQAHCEIVIVGWGGRSASLQAPHAHFVGGRPDGMLRDYYRRCRAVIAPGVSDFDASILEAQACGAPVIAYVGSGATEFVVDAETQTSGTGIFFREPTPESLVSAMREFERRPHKCSPALGWMQAAQYAKARFESTLKGYVSEILAAAGLKHAQDTVRSRSAA